MSESSPSTPSGDFPDGMTPSLDTGVAQADAAIHDAGGCAGLVDCVAPAGCAAREYAGHVYFFCTESLPWQAARERCIAARTDLVIVDDAAENAFVSMHLAATSWIGLTDIDSEGDYRWVEPRSQARAGASTSFTQWAATKPDNCGSGLFGQQDCVRLSTNGKWDDSDCQGGCTEGTFAFLCESY